MRTFYFLFTVFLAMSCLPSQVVAQVNSIAQLDGTKWCTCDKSNFIARLTYRGDLSYFSSGNTCMSFDKVGNVGA